MKTLGLFISGCLLILACNKDHCPNTALAFIDSLSIQDSVNVNGSAEFVVHLRALAGCWDHLFVVMNQRSQFEYNIEAYGQPPCCTECICPPEQLIKDTTFYFKPNMKGKYSFTVLLSSGAIGLDSLFVY